MAKREIRLDSNIKKFVPRTPNVSLYYNDVKNKTDKVYDNKRTEDLLVEYQTSEGERKIAIRNKIIELNLKLVISVARKHCAPEDNLLDLIEEGNIGLIKAVDKYDINKESSFAKLAMFFITGAIRYYKSRSSKVISIKNSHRTYAAIRDIIREFYQKENRKPTCEELMEEYNKRSKKKYQIKEDFLETKIYDIDFHFANENPPGEIATERMDYTNKTCTYNGYEIESDKVYDREIIKTYLNLLTSKEAKVIELIYGLGEDGAEYSYNAISEIMKVTPQRVGQIHLGALKQLREKLIPNYNDSQNQL